MLLLAARNSRMLSSYLGLCLLIIFVRLLIFVPAQAQSAGHGGHADAVATFRKQHYPEPYISVDSITLNSHPYVIAFWNEGGNALSLRADIYRVDNVEGKFEYGMAYSGDFSEEVLGIYAFSMDKSEREQLLVLSNSGHLKIVRVLTLQDNGSMKEVFRNGGEDVTLLSDSREIWIKNPIGREVDVYQWDKETGGIRHERSVSILF